MSPATAAPVLALTLQGSPGLTELATDVVRQLGRDVVAALPAILSGVLFLLIAGAAVRVVTAVLRMGLRVVLPTSEPATRQFVVTVVSLALWFGVLLSGLSLLGLDEIAVSMGTSAGFLALGVGYALSHMIRDVVSGLYLLRDDDFSPGDRVNLDGTTATVAGIGLRKSRFRHDGDVTVRRNADVEQKWTKLDDE